MSLFDFLLQKKEVKKVKAPSMIELFSGFLTRFTSRSNEEFYTSWVATAIRAIAEPIADIKLRLYRQLPDGKIEQVSSHEVLDLLSNVNPHMTFFDMMERIGSNIELQGNEYHFLAYLGKKTPQAIYPLMPQNVSVIPDPQQYIAYYEYSVGGKREAIPRANILHYKTFNPGSDILGLGTLEAAKGEVLNDLYASEYNQKFFQNSGRPDVILEFPATLSPEAEKKLLAQWSQSYGGSENKFKTVVASGGLKVSGFQMTQKDMEFLTGRNFNRDSILAMFRVPPSMLGMSESTSYAAAKAVHYAFMKNVITPKMRRIVNVLNEFLLPLYGDSQLYFDFESPAKEDRDLIIKEYQTGLGSGWLSINDVRRAEELPEIEGGEVVNIPFGLQPLGEPVVDKSVSRDVISKMANDIEFSLEAAFKEMEEDEEIEKENANFDLKGEQRVKKKENNGLEYKKAFDVMLGKLWKGQKERAIKHLNQYMKGKSWGVKAKAPELLDEEFEVAVTIDLATPLFESIMRKEGVTALAELGIEIDETSVITTELTAFVLKNTKKFSGEVTKTTSDMIRAQIATGLEQGEALVDLTKRIQDSAAFNKARSEKIARTETVRAQNQSEQAVWEQSKVVEAKIWYTPLDERTCPDCSEMHQTELGLTEVFFEKGEEAPATGMSLNYEDVGGPPLHPNCRCTLIPVIKS